MAYRSTPTYSFSVPGFTRAVKILLLSTVAVFVLQSIPSFNGPLVGYFALYSQAVLQGQVWRLGTYLFLHAGISHLFWNMFALWMFGVWVEEALGEARFYQLYFVCGAGGAVFDVLGHLWFSPGSMSIPTLGASGAIYGVLLAVGVLFPDRPIFLLIPPVTIKAKWLVLIYGSLEFLFTLRSVDGADGVSHVAHLGGMFFAFLFLQSRLPAFKMLEGYERWRRKRLQRRFNVYMNKRDRHTPPPGGWNQ